ncbi:MAG: ABC transporter ATP-binding protein [Candidatus Brocadiia bacterium]
MAASRKAGSLRQMVALLSPHRVVLGGVFLCFIALAFLELAMPKVLGYVIDNVFKAGVPTTEEALRHSVSMVVRVLVVVLGIYGLRNLLYYVSKPRMIVVGEKVAFDMRQRLISHLHTLSVDFYQRSNPGKISARVLQDVQKVKQFIQDELAKLAINVLVLLVAAGIMFYINWFLTLVTLAVMPFHVLVYYLFRRPIATYAREASERTADVSGNLVEQFDAGGAATVKAAATQLLEQEKIRRSMRKGMQAQIKQSKYYTLQKVSADLLVGLGNIVVVGLGGYLFLYGKGLSAGDFLTFYLVVGKLYPRLLKLVGQAGKFTRTATSVDRVHEILDIEPGVRESERAIPAEIHQGQVEFRDVTFSYNGGKKVLDDVSFTIRPKEHVLITGPSGAGKSTCVNLIPRFYDPQQGQIRVDGRNVRDFTLGALRRQIGFVFQDCFLFNDSVMANIRYAWPQASNEQVIEAACRAYADEFIRRLPNGYNTAIGDGGVQLSAGEKRRLMIARAILKNPKILIMDEPLVSLDREARERALEGLSSLIRDRTVLTISHYPDELPYADRQVHICDGKVTVRELSGEIVRPG